jgi:hypothetical protein
MKRVLRNKDIEEAIENSTSDEMVIDYLIKRIDLSEDVIERRFDLYKKSKTKKRR